MGCLFAAFRGIATAILGALFLATLATWLVAGAVADDLVEADFYITAAREADLYERLYDERLIRGELREAALHVTGGVRVPGEEIVAVVEEIAPPEYLQAQVEAALRSLAAYVREDADSLDVAIDLAEPVGNVRPVISRYVRRYLKELPAREAASRQELLLYLSRTQADLQDGRLPEEVLTYPLTEEEARQAVASMPAATSLEPAERQEVEQALVDGDWATALGIVADATLEPVYERAIAELKLELGEDLRFDPVEHAAREEGVTTAEYLGDLEDARTALGYVRSFGAAGGAAVMAVIAVLILLVHLPDLRRGMLTAGLIVSVSGLLALIPAVAARGASARVIGRAFDPARTEDSYLEPLLRDVGLNMAEGLASGWLLRAGMVLAAGVAAVLVSFVIPRPEREF